MADVAILAIFNNVLGGSSVAYLIPKTGVTKLILPSWLWIFLVSLIGAIVFTIIQDHNSFPELFCLTLLNSLLSLNLTVFVGKEDIRLYNIFSVLSPVLLISFMLGLNYLAGLRSVYSYIYGYMLAQLFVLVLSWSKIMTYLEVRKFKFSRDIIQKAFGYGWKNEMSNFLQFLNYRLSYFFVLYYLGLKQVGIFSVGVAIAESIWIICRSISMVQYSKLINIDDEELSIRITKKSAGISLTASVIAVFVLLIVPSDLYKFVFGAEFKQVKPLLIVMSPGILSMAFSNLHAHFFAARNFLNILIVKSLIGLITTVSLSFIFIAKWGIMGASVIMSVTYLVPSIYILIVFYKDFVLKRSKE
jgi:Membrane protein involved in the export of O-antigen and teichoic acid